MSWVHGSRQKQTESRKVHVREAVYTRAVTLKQAEITGGVLRAFDPDGYDVLRRRPLEGFQRVLERRKFSIFWITQQTHSTPVPLQAATQATDSSELRPEEVRKESKSKSAFLCRHASPEMSGPVLYIASGTDTAPNRRASRQMISRRNAATSVWGTAPTHSETKTCENRKDSTERRQETTEGVALRTETAEANL